MRWRGSLVEGLCNCGDEVDDVACFGSRDRVELMESVWRYKREAGDR